MALKYLVDINLSGNEIQNAALQTVAGEPTGLANGQIIYDTTAQQVKVYNTEGEGGWRVVGLIADETSLTVNAGTISIKDLGVTEGKLAASAVATGKIANDAVTFAKLQNIGENTIVGRNNTGAGNAEALTPAEVRTMINVADGANNYSLPTASATVLGGVKVGTDLAISSGELSVGNNIPRLDAANTFALEQTFSNDVAISGNLTVSGTVTTINTADLDVRDKLITLNVGNTTPATATGSGFQITIDANTTAGITWDNAQGRFVFLDTTGTAQLPFATLDEIPTAETVEDWVGAMVSGNTESGISVTYTDNGASGRGKLNFSVSEQRTDEQVRDLVADVMVTNGSHTGISATDDDTGNGVDLVNSFVHSSVLVSGHAGGTFTTSVSGNSLSLHHSNPIQAQVYAYDGGTAVKTMVLTDTIIDLTNDQINIELPAGDWYIHLSGFRG